MIEATHFIEQINRTEKFVKMLGAETKFSGPYKIQFLEASIKSTAMHESIKTVAIFKIHFKKAI